MITREDRLSGWTEGKLQNMSQSQNCTIQRSWSLTGGLPPTGSTAAFWAQWHHHIWEVCSADRQDTLRTATPAASIGNRMGPTPHKTSVQKSLFKSRTNWTVKLCLIRHIHLTSHQPTTTSSNISATFCRENASATSRRQKTLPKSSLNPETLIFYTIGIIFFKKSFFLVGKNVLIIMAPILINKDLFESSYNDLKFHDTEPQLVLLTLAWTQLPKWLSGKKSASQCRRRRRPGFDPWVGRILWRGKWQPTPVFLPGEAHGQRTPYRVSESCSRLSMLTHTLTWVRANKKMHKTVRRSWSFPRHFRKESASWPFHSCGIQRAPCLV